MARIVLSVAVIMKRVRLLTVLLLGACAERGIEPLEPLERWAEPEQVTVQGSLYLAATYPDEDHVVATVGPAAAPEDVASALLDGTQFSLRITGAAVRAANAPAVSFGQLYDSEAAGCDVSQEIDEPDAQVMPVRLGLASSYGRRSMSGEVDGKHIEILYSDRAAVMRRHQTCVRDGTDIRRDLALVPGLNVLMRLDAPLDAGDRLVSTWVTLRSLDPTRWVF